MEALGGLTVTLGRGTTDIVTVVESMHPLASVPVTVYVVVTLGEAIVLIQVVQPKPVEGFHVYVDAPVAVNEADPPGQIESVAGTTTIIGGGFINISSKEELEHPLESVPMTV